MSLGPSYTTAPPRDSRNSKRPLLPFVDDPDALARSRNRSLRAPSLPPPPPPSPPPTLDYSFSSSSSSSSTDTDMSSSNDNTDVFLGDHKNPPYTKLRRISVDQFLALTTALESYANTKEITDVTKRRTVVMNAFRSTYSVGFFAARHFSLLLLSAQAFRHALISHAVQDRWEDETLRLIDAVRLVDVDNEAFDALEERVTELNDLLVDTAHHLSNEAVKSRLHSALSTDFRDYVRDNDVLISLPFVEWIAKVGALDIKYRSRDRQRARDFEAMRKTQERLEKELANVKRGFAGNQPGQYSNDHSRKQPRTSLTGAGSFHASSSSSSKTPHSSANTRFDVAGTDGIYPCPGYNDLCSKEPRMVDFFRELEMCRRCRTAFAGHISYNCPNTEGPKLKVPHRPLTAALVAFTKSVHDKLKRPITYNAILTASPSAPAKSNPVAALAPMDDISAYSHTSLDNIAALFSPFPVSHVASGSHVFSGDAAGRSSSFFSAPGGSRPIAAVIESTSDDSSGDWSGYSGLDTSWNTSFVAPGPAPVKITDFFTKTKPKVSVDPMIPVSAVPVASQEDSPFRVPHLLWNTTLDVHGADGIPVSALLDDGAHLVLIRNDLVTQANLKRHRLPQPISASLASTDTRLFYTHYVNITLTDPISRFSSRPVRALVTDSLCTPVLLGLPFLVHNRLVTDYAARSVINKDTLIDLLNPVAPRPRDARSPKEKRLEICRLRLTMIRELKSVLLHRFIPAEPDYTFDAIAAFRARIETIEDQERRRLAAEALVTEFDDVFGEIPHIDELPQDILCEIKLKDATAPVHARSYASPRKYKESWQKHIDKHVKAGRIRLSSSHYTSPGFLIPKKDPGVLPRWVNDYRILNANTVPDRHPLPRIDAILADCAKGKVFGKMDMTDSFFQTRLHPDSIPLTAVMTPLGLYEWLVMPQGLRNAPSIQQRRVTAALRPYIGVFCHVYLDDIIIWSKDDVEHAEHVRIILAALREAKLFCNRKKCAFFLDELDFLGYHISQKGVEAQHSKIDAILNFPRPRTAEETRRFLGMVRFIAGFLVNLADYTRFLTPLTRKECDKNFPDWTVDHEDAFEAIKRLVVSREVLTVIDHDNPGENKIFVVCDASEWRTGAVLMWGPTLATAKPVAFDSAQLCPAELNYPVHEKELLAIVRALKKWRADCIGMPIFVLTDHRTLENFNTQKDLSRRQLRWQEFLSQYDLSIAYIKGTENLGADALSRVPNGRYIHEAIDEPSFEAWPGLSNSLAAVLSISSSDEYLRMIKEGYSVDSWCKKLSELRALPHGITKVNGLWYSDARLIIPRHSTLREDLFRIAHDDAGHYGFDKSYASLRNAYYWPNMRRDLENAYVPGCEPCQRNKDSTTRKTGPLHPLPVPDGRLLSVGMDFVGPLPEDDGCDCILTMTCRLGADVRLAATNIDIDAPEAAFVFFREWYCENGLPDNLVIDRDKLWMSRFWTAFALLTGIKLKASSAYHPQADGASEKTNKTMIQSIRYFVDRHHKGWAKSLPIVRFNIMSSVNSSTGMSMHLLKTGREPRRLPLIDGVASTNDRALEIVQDMLDLEHEAQDALLSAKVMQAAAADNHRGDPPKFAVDDFVMLTTLHKRKRAQRERGLVGKFFARKEGPYRIKRAMPQVDAYVLDMPNAPTKEGHYNVDFLTKYIINDDILFPSRRLDKPGPVPGTEEHE